MILTTQNYYYLLDTNIYPVNQLDHLTVQTEDLPLKTVIDLRSVVMRICSFIHLCFRQIVILFRLVINFFYFFSTRHLIFIPPTKQNDLWSYESQDLPWKN